MGLLIPERLESRLLFTSVPGQTINTAVEWTAANSPYNLTGGVTVGVGGSLTIDSGVTVTGSALTVASGGAISASGAHFGGAITAQQGASGSVSSSFFNASTTFDNTGVTLSDDTFTTNPSVYPTYVPTLVGNGDTFAAGTIIELQGATLSTPLTFGTVANVSAYNLPDEPEELEVGVGGSLTIQSGVTMTQSYGGDITIASGGTISATGVHFGLAVIAEEGGTGSITSSFFDVSPTFDNTGVTLSDDTFTTNPSVYPTYVPTLVGNGDTFAAGTIIELQGATLSTPLTIPAASNVSSYNFPDEPEELEIGAGGALTIQSGVTITQSYGGEITVDGGGEISADGVTFGCRLFLNGSSTVSIENCDFSASSVTAQGSGGPIPLANNWWGTTVISSVEAKITDQSDNANLPAVAYLPILSAKPTLEGVASTISLGTSTNSANLGDSVTLTATLGGAAGTAPTGTVNFVANGTYLGTALVQNGVAALSTTALPAGSDQVSAVYTGDVNYSGNTSSPAAVSVVTIIGTTPSTTTLGASTSQAVQGAAVTFTATVSGNGATPTGTVTFTQNGNVLGSEAVQENGTAQISTSSLSLGSDLVIASYSGDTTYAASTSSSFPIDVTATALSASTITAASSSNPAPFGTAVTFVATVSSASGSGPTPTGTVTFFNNGVEINAAALNASGQASITTSSLPAGSDPITASYSGDSNYSVSTLSPESETILPPSPIVPTLHSVLVPPVIVAGQKFVGKVTLVIANPSTKITGIFTLDLYLSNSATLDGSQTLVSAANKKLTLKPNGSSNFVFSLKPLSPSLATGTYYVISQITDPNGDKNTSGAMAIQVAAPTVSLTASVAAVNPATIAAKKSGSIAVTITNTGNVNATGPMVISLSPSDGVTPGSVTLMTVTEHPNIKPGKSIKYTLHFKNTGQIAVGSYYPYVALSLDTPTLGTVSTTAFGSQLFTLG